MTNKPYPQIDENDPVSRFTTYYRQAYIDCLDKCSFDRGHVLSAIELFTDITYGKLTDVLQHKIDAFHKMLDAYNMIRDRVYFEYDDDEYEYEYDVSDSDLQKIMSDVDALYKDAATPELDAIEFGDIDKLNEEMDKVIKFIKNSPEGDVIAKTDMIQRLFKEYVETL